MNAGMVDDSEPVSLALRREVRGRMLRTGAIAVVLGGALAAVGAFAGFAELERGGRNFDLAIYGGGFGGAILVGGLIQIARAFRSS